MNDEAYEAPYEILDLGPTRRVRWLHGSVRIPFFAGTADGLERTYATPPPLATSANRQRYVLAVADGEVFYLAVSALDMCPSAFVWDVVEAELAA